MGANQEKAAKLLCDLVEHRGRVFVVVLPTGRRRIVTGPGFVRRRQTEAGPG